MKKDKTNLEKYSDIQAMVQKEARDIALSVYKEQATQFGVAKVGLHYHNDIDLPKINQKDIVQNVKYNTFLVVDATETIFLKNIPNVSRLAFYGFAADNAGGGAATKRATVSGEVQFGKCFNFSGTGSVINLDNNLSGVSFVQGGNYIYVDATSQRVGSSNIYFIYVNDGTNNLALAQVTQYNNRTIEIDFTLASGWKLQGSLFLT